MRPCSACDYPSLLLPLLTAASPNLHHPPSSLPLLCARTHTHTRTHCETVHGGAPPRAGLHPPPAAPERSIHRQLHAPSILPASTSQPFPCLSKRLVEFPDLCARARELAGRAAQATGGRDGVEAPTACAEPQARRSSCLPPSEWAQPPQLHARPGPPPLPSRHHGYPPPWYLDNRLTRAHSRVSRSGMRMYWTLRDWKHHRPAAIHTITPSVGRRRTPAAVSRHGARSTRAQS